MTPSKYSNKNLAHPASTAIWSKVIVFPMVDIDLHSL